MTDLTFPDEASFLEAFGVEPSDMNPADGYWQYSFLDDSGTKLNLSFNKFERSFQVALFKQGLELCIISHAGEFSFSIWKEVSAGGVKSAWTDGDAKTRVSIQICPSISVQWATLRDRR